MKIELKTGTLEIALNSRTASPDSEYHFEDLIGFGSRAHNKKRGFVFVSKVLGKHYPAKPSDMDKIHAQLAKLIRAEINDAPTMVIGFAETATGLGFGVYQKLDLKEVFYIHTTRYELPQPVWLNFEEEHSHATSHRLYEIENEALLDLRSRVENVILVDDEFSTGNTLKNLATQLKPKLPHAKRFIGASILSWMPADLPDITCVNLYKGRFNFTQKALNENTKTSVKSVPDKHAVIKLPNFGRLGTSNISLNYQDYINIDDFKNKKVLVLGTGEFMCVAFLIAKYLENNGIEVFVQSSTRSPLNVDADIESKLHFKDNYFENIDNFLYNIKPYDKIIVCYEIATLPKNHHLPELLKPYANEVITLFFNKI